jgi:hypothetical protein
MLEVNTERSGGGTMQYALKFRNRSRSVANQIIVLPFEQPFLFIQWRLSWNFHYHHRWILAMVETNTERIRRATMLYALKIRFGSKRVPYQITLLPFEQPLLFIQWRLSFYFQTHHRWFLAMVETNTEWIRWATMLYALKIRFGSRRVANHIIVLPLEQPLLFILWRLSWSF